MQDTSENPSDANSERRHTSFVLPGDDAPIVEWAVAYALAGYWVFPVHYPKRGRDGKWWCSCGKADCPTKAKHPKCDHGYKDATTDLAQIRRWFREPCNISLWCREHVVLDVDLRKGGAGSLASLCDKYGPLPDTPTVLSGSGGPHYYFVPPSGLTIVGRSDAFGSGYPGLDLEAVNGGCTLAPPSLHISGNHYCWEHSLRLGEIPLAPLPQWIIDLTNQSRRKYTNGADTKPHEPVPLAVAETALGFVDAENYDVWLRVGMALKSEYGCHGRPLWDSWSKKSAKFNAKDQDKTWASIDVDGGITIASIIRLAKDAGWDPNQRPGAERTESSESNSWPVLDKAAYQGLAEQFLDFVSPHTEADEVGLLIHFLVMFGNAAGKHMYYEVGHRRHHLNLNALAIGDSSKARKGSARAEAEPPFQTADADWFHNHVVSGLSSGEGLIWAIRDPIFKNEKNKQGIYHEVQVDPGIADKRLLVVEEEFSSVLKVASREHNTLIDVMRDAFDGRDLRTLTKNSPARATAPHISIIGHITTEELLRYLDRTEMANGLANRFLFVLVKRSKVKSRSTNCTAGELQHLANRLSEALASASQPRRMEFSPEAAELWDDIYPQLSAGRAGLLGAILARGEVQVLRLSLVYAGLDSSVQIEKQHLEAALALWRYCEASTEYIFGDTVGDPEADMILNALRANREGLTRTQIADLFHRNLSAAQMERALGVLSRAGLAKAEMFKPPVGRPYEKWTVVTGAGRGQR